MMRFLAHVRLFVCRILPTLRLIHVWFRQSCLVVEMALF